VDGDGTPDVADVDDGRQKVGGKRAASRTAAADCCTDSAGPPENI